MELHDSWFFIGVFIFIFLVWIITGGPMHPISFSGPTLASPQELGGGSYLSFPRAAFGIGGGTNVSLPGSSSGGGALDGASLISGGSGQANTPTLIGGATFGNPSPYRNVISLSHSVSGAGSTAGTEYLTLSVADGAGVPVDISGWTIESEATGNAMTIPQGTELPSSGIVNAAQDIVLTPGEHAYLISGRSPIGASFRENKCIGYFSSYQKFSPSLPQNCPSPSDELLANYGSTYIRDAACINYMNTLSRCQVALTPPTGATSACQSFVVKYLNYNGCVAVHQGDADFAGDTWHVYLGRTTPMWRTEHEIVKLLDKEGKTVDAFAY
jgi:hypothetical protein